MGEGRALINPTSPTLFFTWYAVTSAQTMSTPLGLFREFQYANHTSGYLPPTCIGHHSSSRPSRMQYQHYHYLHALRARHKRSIGRDNPMARMTLNTKHIFQPLANLTGTHTLWLSKPYSRAVPYATKASWLQPPRINAQGLHWASDFHHP